RFDEATAVTRISSFGAHNPNRLGPLACADEPFQPCHPQASLSFLCRMESIPEIDNKRNTSRDVKLQNSVKNLLTVRIYWHIVVVAKKLEPFLSIANKPQRSGSGSKF